MAENRADSMVEGENPTSEGDAAADIPVPESGADETTPEGIGAPASTENASKTAEPLPIDDELDDDEELGTSLAETIIKSMPSEPVVVKKRYRVMPGNPLAELDSPTAKAFEAEDQDDPRHSIFALVCIPNMPVRMTEIHKIVGKKIPANLRLIDFGSIQWPGLERVTIVLIYERPRGGTVADVIASDIPETKKLQAISLTTEAGIVGLRELDTRGIMHGAVRPNNIYFLDEECTQVVLGEFVSAPPGCGQPVAVETIERGMAMESGRGVGSALDDLYSFGATLAVITQKVNPVEGKPWKRILLSKCLQGSFLTLVGRTLISTSIYEMLRGLLNDDPALRWDFDQIETWITNRRIPPVQSRPIVKAQRALKFGGIDHFLPRTLAFVMHLYPEEALKLIHAGHIEQWLSRSLENNDTANAVAAAVAIAEGQAGSKFAEDILLTRVLTILDPDGPMRYRGLAIMPAAFGSALAINQIRGGQVSPYAEIVTNAVPSVWFEGNESLKTLKFQTENQFARLKTYLTKTGIGFGMERCLYETNPNLACQSPLLTHAYVTTVKRLLPALNIAAKTGGTEGEPIDRHIAAFIGARFDRKMDTYLDELASADEAIKAMGLLHLLAHIQSEAGPDQLMELTAWVGNLMSPATLNFRSRTTRRQMEKDIPRLVQEGSLTQLLDLLDNLDSRSKDDAGYYSAIQKFRAAEVEIAKIEKATAPRSSISEKKSKQIAAATGVTIMALALILLLVT